MNLKKSAALSLFCIIAALGTIAIIAESQEIPGGATILKPYLSPYNVSKLEWYLMKFNLDWHDSYKGGMDYLRSRPAFFDCESNRFTCIISILEKRSYDDPEPFFGLPKSKQLAILQGCVDHFEKLLSMPFPEIEDNKQLILIEFWISAPGGGKSTVAKYENGELQFTN